MKTIAIIPAHNESIRLQAVLDGTLKYVDHIVLVDDGSRDSLMEKLCHSERITVLRHLINLGKGAALKTGVHWAVNEGYDVAVFLDADGQHNPEEIPKLLEPIINLSSEIVFGVRSFHQNMPLVSRMGNILLTQVVQAMYHIRVDDTQSGFRAIRLSIFEKIGWKSARYSVETEMIVNAGKNAIRYSQVPISTIYHDKYKGTTVVDGIRILFNMVMWRFL